MKRLKYVLVVLAIISLLTACGSKAQSPEPTKIVEETNVVDKAPAISIVTSPTEIPQKVSIDYEFEGALSGRLLLALGSLKLAETSFPITADQAPQMLMLWQALDNLTQSGNSAEAEVTAILSQIDQAFTSDQAASINAMVLTQEELQSWAQANGVTLGTGIGTGQGMGQGTGLSPEAKATKQAENGMVGNAAAGGSGLSAAITEALITYLATIK